MVDLTQTGKQVVLIQRDAGIKEDAIVISQEGFDEYLKTMKTHHLNGTDFRPMLALWASYGKAKNLPISRTPSILRIKLACFQLRSSTMRRPLY